ncbi:class F sortase [Patescibacteria group bacterium]|nr:MAG: class F sortase [Patescibacteria group bacterium]
MEGTFENPATMPRQRFSKLTPIYAPTKITNPKPTQSTRRMGIEFVKDQKGTTKRPIHDNAKDKIDFVEANLDMIDLDLAVGIQEPTTNFIEQYFQQQSNVAQKQHRLHKSRRHITIRPRHIVRGLIVLLIVSAIGLWVYDSTAVSSREAHAVAAQTPPASNNVVDTTNYIPKTLTITKLGINASIESVATTANGAMGVPGNIWNAAWYNKSAKPGQAGAVFIDGHSSSTDGALFGKLNTLAKGDIINVMRADNIVINYKVMAINVVNRSNVDMSSMLKPYGTSRNGLNILSCQGKWLPSEETLENRVLVYAVQI